jgi:hypothetical protein
MGSPGQASEFRRNIQPDPQGAREHLNHPYGRKRVRQTGVQYQFLRRATCTVIEQLIDRMDITV